MALDPALQAHLGSGATSVCRCWSVTRRDGTTYGLTDHDRNLVFDGIDFAADSGLSARALEQSTGLSVDNTEAVGVLSLTSVNETDIRAGRYDGATVKAWLVNWSNPDQRSVLFAGSIGEIQRGSGVYQAEIRGLSENLNKPQGRVYQKNCNAVLGDQACGFDLSQPGYGADIQIGSAENGKFLTILSLTGFADRWFEKGRITFNSGKSTGLVGLIKNDRMVGPDRTLELWEAMPADVTAGDWARIEPGCDKSPGTCGGKFNNILNFRGFPNIPGEDWMTSVPRKNAVNDGGKLRL